MPLPQRLDTADTCGLTERWGICLPLAVKLDQLQKSFPFQLKIFSGFRTPEHQARLPTAAPVSRSTHTSCPATGADISVDWTSLADLPIPLPIPPWLKVAVNLAVTPAMKLYFGEAVKSVGLRWGGGAPVDADGVPRDPEWHHVDLGPRPR